MIPWGGRPSRLSAARAAAAPPPPARRRGSKQPLRRRKRLPTALTCGAAPRSAWSSAAGPPRQHMHAQRQHHAPTCIAPPNLQRQSSCCPDALHAQDASCGGQGSGRRRSTPAAAAIRPEVHRASAQEPPATQRQRAGAATAAHRSTRAAQLGGCRSRHRRAQQPQHSAVPVRHAQHPGRRPLAGVEGPQRPGRMPPDPTPPPRVGMHPRLGAKHVCVG